MARPTSPRTLQFTLIAVASMMSIISSLGAPLIGTIALATHVALSTATWMLTAMLLVGALATPIMGRLADGKWQRHVVLGALVIVIIGLVTTALSRNFTWLIIGRCLQGVGMGLMPVTMTIARRHLDPAQAQRTIASLSISVAVGVGLGYPLTSVIAQFFDYHAAFWCAAVVIAGALVVAWRVLPTVEAGPSRRFDIPGAVLLTVAMAALLGVLGEGEVWGWTSPRSLVVGVTGLLAVLAWAKYEVGRDDPLVDLRQSAHPMVVASDLAAFIIAMAMYLYIPVVIEFVGIPRSTGYGFGASIVTSGLALVPMSVGTYAASRVVPLVMRRLPARYGVPIGSMIFATSTLFFAVEHRYVWEAFVGIGLAGIGAGFTFALMPGHIVAATPAADTGAALGLYQLVRSIGLSMGSAVAGSILSHFTAHGQSLPSVRGFTTTLYLGTGLLLVAALVSFVMMASAHRSDLSTSPNLTHVASAVHLGEGAPAGPREGSA